MSLTPILSNGQIGVAYNQTASATGGIGPYKWTLASGKLPAGLTLNATTGVLSGTPTVAASFKFPITVTDSEQTPATFTQAYTISTAPDPLTVPYQKFDCKVHSPCTGSFTATGGVPPYKWSVAAHTVQPGQNPIYVTPPPTLTFSTDGSFSGVPTQWAALPYSGDILFTITVTDSETPAVSESDTADFAIASDLVVVSIPLPATYLGSTYFSPAPTASGGAPPYKWTIEGASSSYYPDFYANDQGQLGFPTPKGGAPTTAGQYLFNYVVSDSETVPASASMEATLDILPTPITSITTLSSSDTTAGTGMNVTLTANVTATGGTPSGVVTFYNGSTSLGTATLDATGAASFTTSFSAAGVYTLTASYAGGGAVTGSVSAPLTETVVTPTVSAAITPGSITIKSGTSGTLVITLTPAGGYTGTVGFSCGTLPTDVYCTFAPPSITLTAGSAAVTDTLTINTTATHSAMLSSPLDRGRPSQAYPATIFWLPGSLAALIGVFPRKRKRPFARRLWMLAVLFLGLGGTAVLSGCGGLSNDARPGTYAIPVTLTLSGGVTQTVNSTVIVQ